MGQKTEKEGRLSELVGDLNPGPKASSMSKKGRGGRKGNVRRGATARGATARGAMEKSRYARGIEGKEVREDDPIENFLPTGVRSSF